MSFGSLGLTDEHVELAEALRSWAAKQRGAEVARAAEGDPAASFADVRRAAAGMGVGTVALPERFGGGGGSLLDAVVALEACARELLPGPLLGTALVSGLVSGLASTALEEAPGVDAAWSSLAAGSVVGVGPAPSLEVGTRVAGRLTGTVAAVWDAPGADRFLLGGVGDVDGSEERWFLVPADAVRVEAGAQPLDLSRRFGTVTVDAALEDTVPLPGLSAGGLRRVAVTLAAAEAAGAARWCLDTAVSYAGVREQFGGPIGRFQAVKHLCAQMLETSEAVTAAAWDVASAASGEDRQWDFAADVAEVVCLDGAVEVAKSCIQVLGGIGFTFEHDAHLYLRRALSLRGLVGRPEAAAARLAGRAVDGVRRELSVDLQGRDEPLRAEVRECVAAIAARPATEWRAALAGAGYLAPHWPVPYGLGADPVTQVVVDQELARAGVERPDLVIAAWAVPTILEHGTDEQRERFVRPSLLGELVWCQLFSEPGAGSDLASLRTRAVREEGGWRLTGQKVWTSLADRADWAICLARTDPEVPQHRGISYFLVDMRSPGIEVRPLREMTGRALFNEVFLDDVRVPDDCLVGQPGDGWRLARTTLANERVAMGSNRLGLSTERAVTLLAEQEATTGAQEPDRVAVGGAVALSTVCSLLGLRTTLRSLDGQGPGAESSVAKLLGVRSRQDAAELVVSLHGAAGVLGGPGVVADVEELLNTRCLSIAGGTTQVLRNVVAERVLGLPR